MFFLFQNIMKKLKKVIFKSPKIVTKQARFWRHQIDQNVSADRQLPNRDISFRRATAVISFQKHHEKTKKCDFLSANRYKTRQICGTLKSRKCLSR